MVLRIDRAFSPSPGTWELGIYVAGKSAFSQGAIANAKALCDAHLKGRYTLHVIDLSKDPGRAVEDGIFAVPTLIRFRPPPYRKLVGDLTKFGTERILKALAIA